MFKHKRNVAMICLVASFLLGAMSYSFVVVAEELSPQQQIDRKAVEKGLDESLGMPVLKGELWQKMTHDEKVAFISGVRTCGVDRTLPDGKISGAETRQFCGQSCRRHG